MNTQKKAKVSIVKEVSEGREKGTPWREAFKDLINETSEAATCLRGFRYREDLTQKELAERVGITQGNLCALENGKRPIDKEMAKRLAKILNTNYKHFL